MKTITAASAAILLSVTAAYPSGLLRITDAEKAACQGDAIRLCSTAFPDEAKLLVCMKGSRAVLTPGCRTVFDAGLRRRGIDDRLAQQTIRN